MPYPPDKGDRIRAFHLLKSVAQRAALHLACLADEPVPAETVAELERLCRRVAIVPVSRSRWLRALGSVALGRTVTEGAFSSSSLRALVCSWARQTPFRACLASASSMVPYLRLPELRSVPAVVDLVDVDSQKWLDYAATTRPPRSWLYRVEGRRLRRLEAELTGWARAVTLVSPAEADLYRHVCGDGPVHAIGNGVDLDYFRPAPLADGQGLAFVGALDYLPNVEGACWFCREVWPEVLRVRPAARFAVIGRRPAPAVQRLAELPGVELVGQVPDVRPHVAKAAVVVAPLQIARGVQNKVLEALAMARAVVASPQALAGIRALPDSHLLAASSPAEWVGHIVRLLDDPGRRQQLGAAGRRYVEDNHDWERCLEPFAPLLGMRNGQTPALPSLRSAVASGEELP